jgi:chromosome segregation ATPase
VPKLPATVSRLEAEQARLQRELDATKKTLSKLRAKQSTISYGLSEVHKDITAAKAAASTEMTLETSTARFVARDLHPDAAAALKEFASQVVDAYDGSPLWLSEGTVR